MQALRLALLVLVELGDVAVQTQGNKSNLYTAKVQDGRRLQRFVFKGLAKKRP